jgi:hypothetical protein
VGQGFGAGGPRGGGIGNGLDGRHHRNRLESEGVGMKDFLSTVGLLCLGGIAVLILGAILIGKPEDPDA